MHLPIRPAARPPGRPFACRCRRCRHHQDKRLHCLDNDLLRAACCVLRAACCVLPATRRPPPAACCLWTLQQILSFRLLPVVAGIDCATDICADVCLDMCVDMRTDSAVCSLVRPSAELAFVLSSTGDTDGRPPEQPMADNQQPTDGSAMRPRGSEAIGSLGAKFRSAGVSVMADEAASRAVIDDEVPRILLEEDEAWTQHAETYEELVVLQQQQEYWQALEQEYWQQQEHWQALEISARV